MRLSLAMKSLLKKLNFECRTLSIFPTLNVANSFGFSLDITVSINVLQKIIKTMHEKILKFVLYYLYLICISQRCIGEK